MQVRLLPLRLIEENMIELDRIYNEDCLVGMQRIPDGSVDCIICDLPYGTTACKWDTIIPFEPLWEQYERIIKDNGAIVLFCKQPFTSKLILSNIDWYKYELIWEKSRVGNNMQLGKKPASIHENIIVFYKKAPTFNEIKFQVDEKYIDKRKSIRNSSYSNSEHYKGEMQRKKDDGWRHSQSILPFNSVWSKGMHPTQKPVVLIEYLIKTYTNEGELVLDNCMGSGTTAVAAINTGRRFIGFELQKEYFDIANKRIDEARMNAMTLFK